MRIVPGSRYRTGNINLIPQNYRHPACALFEARSDELKTLVAMKDFEAIKHFMKCNDCSTWKVNLDGHGGSKVMMQGMYFGSIIQTNLLASCFASAELYYMAIMIVYINSTQQLHTFSRRILSICTTFGKYEMGDTKLIQSVEEIDADGDDHQKSNRSDSKGGRSEERSSGSGLSGGVNVSSGGADRGSSAGGDDGDDEHGRRKQWGGPQSKDGMEAEEKEEKADAEELEDDEESDPNKKMIGGCGRIGNWMRRTIEEDEEKEEAERHRQAMIAHYEAWEQSNAAARAYVRKHIAKVEPEAPSLSGASGSNVVYDDDHPAFSSSFAVSVPPPGSRFSTRPEPVASTSYGVGDIAQAVVDVAPAASKLEEEDPEGEREPTDSSDVPSEEAPSRSPSPPSEAVV